MQTASFFAPDASAEPSDDAPVDGPGGGQEEEGTERLLQLVCSLTERLTEVQEENQHLRSQLGAAAEPLAGAGGQTAAQPAPLPGLPDALSTPMVSAHHCYVRGHRGAQRTADCLLPVAGAAPHLAVAAAAVAPSCQPGRGVWP